MNSQQPKFQPITPARSRASSRPRTLSRPRSSISRRREPGTLQRAYTAQSFDDHAAYNRSNSSSEADVASPNKTDGIDREKEPVEEADTSSFEEHSISHDDREDVERGADEPVPAMFKEKSNDPYFVTWTKEDPENPKNWKMSRKWAATFVVSMFTLISPVSSSMVAPALVDMDRDLGIHNQIESAMVLSIFVLAYAIGPLFLGPMSEIYGRVVVLQLANLWYLVWNLAGGFAHTSAQIFVFRFLSGLGGSAPLAVGGAVLGDCFNAEQRGKAISIYSLAPLLGPAIGPIAGGFIAQNTTWRWIFWSTTIFDAAIQVVGLVYLQETYAPLLLQRRAAKLRKDTGNEAYYTEFDHEERTWSQVMKTAMIRPFRMLATQPIIQAIAVYMAFIYGLMYLVLASFPTLWTIKYGLSTQKGSLNYISLGLGFGLGSQISSPINDRVYRKLKAKNNGIGRPEFRVPAMFVGSFLIPIGLFMYGWSAQAHTHWIVPDIGAAIFSAGAICCFQAMQTYIVDSYTRFAASGLAAAVVMRSLCGFGFPLFANKLYDSLGYGWGNSLLAFIAIGLGIPAPVMFWKFGERLRAKSKFASG